MFKFVLSLTPSPPLEGISTPWVCVQEIRQHPVSFDTKADKMTAAILNFYGRIFEFQHSVNVTKPIF